ncbi:MAG: hypothetical protein HW405_214 [Candidatus Berkelbacteria bacterium]|nr:hypothetical protein [Candidatus Berkelbacteria bacterium]
MRKKAPLINKRIFVGFNHAGAAGIWQFTRILRKRGYQIDFYGLDEERLGMSVDFLLKFSNNRIIALYQKIIYFFKILPRYDIWHLNFMEGFFFYPLNLLILKIFDKKIVLTFRGAEVRTNIDFMPETISGKIPQRDLPEYYRNIYENKDVWKNFLKKLRMRIFIKFADKVVLTGPFLASQVTRFDKIIPYARDIGELKKYSHNQHKKITILHVPTEPIVKGTPEIRKIFQKLQKKYKNINFKILERMPRDKLLLELSKADIVIDQIIVGWYGGQAVEALAMGKIVLAYLHPPYFALVSYGKEIPIINSSFWTLENDLESTIINFEHIKEQYRHQGIKFAKKYHDNHLIAREYLNVYKSVQ